MKSLLLIFIILITTNICNSQELYFENRGDNDFKVFITKSDNDTIIQGFLYEDKLDTLLLICILIRNNDSKKYVSYDLTNYIPCTNEIREMYKLSDPETPIIKAYRGFSFEYKINKNEIKSKNQHGGKKKIVAEVNEKLTNQIKFVKIIYNDSLALEFDSFIKSFPNCGGYFHRDNGRKKTKVEQKLKVTGQNPKEN